MSARSLLDLPEPTHDLEVRAGSRVWLAAIEPDGPLRDAVRIVIRGEGYEWEREAASAGERWRDITCRALARLHLAADFGERMPYGQFTEEGERWASAQFGHPVISDVPGVTVFRCNPDLRFVRSQAEGCRRPTPEQSAAVFTAAAKSGDRLDPVERLAFDLYSGSFFQPSADARFLMLMMAVETMLDPAPRSAVARSHVQQLIDATTTAELPDAERKSLNGSLSWLMNESIGQAGRRLARRLEPRRYRGRTPSAFFTDCYTMRSGLVHGSAPRPTRDEVDSLAATLEMFVGHLLSGDLLDAIAD